MRQLATLALLSLLPLIVDPALAQEAAGAVPDSTRRSLPPEIADRVIAFYNDPARVRLVGDVEVDEGDTIRADVAALDGPLLVRGRIEGELVMLNGDVRLEAGSSVTGSVTVVGGTLEVAEDARVGGEMLSYSEALAYRRSGIRLARVDDADAAGWGRADFLVATGRSYNRVEGLPITFGPRIRTAGSNPLRVDALAVYRTESGLTLDPEAMGYFARVEQFIGGFRSLRVGFTAHSLVDPIEEWGVSDLESGLSTFLLHEDHRDHYERQGVSVYASLTPPRSPLELGIEARREAHRSLASGSPWTLSNNGDRWRAQPLVGEGDVTTIGGTAAFDSRNDSADPATGWLVRARVEQAVRSTLAREAAFLVDPAPGGPAGSPSIEALGFGLFSSAFVDIRRYNRVDPDSRLNFRLVAGGSLDGDALPPQRQHALGGEGSLPGYPLFELDCGAREALVYRPGMDGGSAPFYPRYGCDAFGLFQADYRGRFAFRFLWDSVPWSDEVEEDEHWGFAADVSPEWTVFVDAGQAWSYDGGPDEELAADVGLGVLLGRLGVFVAVPVTGGEGVNLFARIGPRF